MTEPRDPVESWLSKDVELLPPPPGAYERVHSRARRRRAVRAAGAACGAAAVIAAAVVVPQVAGNLFPKGGAPAVANGTTRPAATQSPKPPSTAPSPHRSTAHTQGARGPALTTAGSGAAAEAGFLPTSVTFISGGSLGAVIGQARCPSGPCTAMAGSADYGRHWTRIGAPPAGPPNGAAGVSQIRFGDTMNGWAFGPSLYATHDGGTSWHLVNMPGRVIDLSVVTAQVFAVVATCSGSGSAYTAGCTQFTLYQAPARSNRWQRVAGVPAVSRFTPGGLQLTSAGGYLLAGRQLFSGPLTGGPWHRVGSGSATVPQCLRTPGAVPGPAFIAQAQLVLYLACDAGQAHGSLGPARLTLYSSPDGGLTWQRAGPIPAPGAPTSLAAIPAGAIVLATTKGIEYSADGTHWQSASLAGSQPRGGFSYVGMTTTTNGVAVPARSASGVLFVTTDGGATWVRSRISR